MELTDTGTVETSQDISMETQAVTTEALSLDTSLDVIVEAAVNGTSETVTYSSESLQYISASEDGEMNLVPSTVQLVAEGSDAVDTEQWSQFQERDSLDFVSTAEDGMELLPEKLPRISHRMCWHTSATCVPCSTPSWTFWLGT